MGAPTMRQYGATIAPVTGAYSLLFVIIGGEIMKSMGSVVMGLLGIIGVGHGVILLTSYGDRLGIVSGPIIIGYLVLMLIKQAAISVNKGRNWRMGGRMGTGMDSGMDSSIESGMTAGITWNHGMVALTVLTSGVIMANRCTCHTGK